VKTVQRAIRAIVCGVCAATALPAVAAETKAGFYLGLSAGESSFDIEKSELDDVVLDAFFSQGIPVTSGSSKFEDSDTALSLFAGYRFNPYIAVEAGYIDLGAAEYRSTGTVNPPGPIVSAPIAVDIDVESKGFTLGALGSLPLGEVVDLHGHLGFLFATTDLSVTARSTSTSASTEELDSIGGFYGVGVGVNLGAHWSLSLDWTRYDNVGDENDDDDVSTQAGFDIDALSFSAMFRF
jgi:OmpA-OmpF porin, OOP family